METTRIDRWLAAVRIYKQRSIAADACGGGKVRLNGTSVKPATKIKAGDRIEARIGDRRRIVEVVRVIEKRVGAPIASECYIDHSPPPHSADDRYVAQQARRAAGTGRPTKRDRRNIDKWRQG